MNLLIDVHIFCRMFTPSHCEHEDFLPVLKSIASGKSTMVYGGSKYLDELSKVPKYLSLINEWRKTNKAVLLSDKSVDAEMTEAITKESSNDFDDPHLIAIVIVGRAPIVCTKDTRAEPYLKDSKFYSGKGISRPRIYKYKAHSALLPS